MEIVKKKLIKSDVAILWYRKNDTPHDGNCIHIFTLMEDSMEYKNFLPTQFFHRTYTVTVGTCDANRDSETNQTCSSGSFQSIHAGLQCATSIIQCPDQHFWAFLSCPTYS